MTFFDIFRQHEWEESRHSVYAKTARDVERALTKNTRRDLEDFKALISPAAQPYLEQMAQLSRQITQKRFGKTMQLYIPMYLSNECTNSCKYCGFRHENKTNRVTLSAAQVLTEANAIRQMGFEHLLLVAGEHPRNNGYAYLSEMMQLLRPLFAQVSMEVAPLDTDEYTKLVQQGMYAVYVYQETYHAGRYPEYHPRGRKADMRYRLETGDRLGAAGVRKVGLGCLLGLEDWRTDSFFTALHLDYLEKKYWQTRYSVSFPRIRPFEGSFEPNSIVSDADLLQLVCAYRIFNEEVEIALSTRESPVFRDNLVALGITSMSAGSRTDPGGYALESSEQKQFEISDDRDPVSFTNMIRSKGYEVVWKDWDPCLQTQSVLL